MITPIHKNNLKNYTTFGISSVAKKIQIINSYTELLQILEKCLKSEELYLVLGEGSNVVPPDTGINKLVLINRAKKISQEGMRLSIDSGTLLSDVISFCIRKGLSGAEYLSGIPGTIGGAVVGNAGAYGHSISEVVENVEIWDGGEIRVLTAAECGFSYRNSTFKNSGKIILKVVLKLEKGNKDKLKQISKEIIIIRTKKYPKGILCPGSFFKNILASDLTNKQLSAIDKSKIIGGKLPAGYLLESVGAKGLSIGGISVSDVHGNLILNIRNGSSQDVLLLSKILKDRVMKSFGISLEEEIRYIN